MSIKAHYIHYLLLFVALNGYSQVGYIEFTSYKNPNKTIQLDTLNHCFITLRSDTDWTHGYIWGSVIKADSNYLYLKTDQIYNNCYFTEIPYEQIDSSTYIAKLDRSNTLYVSWPKKHEKLNLISETIAWTSVATILLSPIVCINYKNWTFNEKRYFGINRIALSTFTVRLTMYLSTDFKNIKLSKKPIPKEKRVYY